MVSSAKMSHLLVCAGSVGEWQRTSDDDWRLRLDIVGHAAQVGGAEWATIVPVSAHPGDDPEIVRTRLEQSCGGVRYAQRVVVLGADGVTVVVDPSADGQRRIVDAAARVAASSSVTEDRLSAAITAPAPSEPDLVVVLSDATTMPSSLVWELAYAEIVFLNVPWSELNAEHLEMAIDDFTRRDRRFGGVDS